MRTDLVEYLSDAISRAEAGGVTSPYGSWLAGMFGKAANLFEKEFGSHVDCLLGACGLTYPKDFKKVPEKAPSYEKLTLGQLIAVNREAGKRRPEISAQHIPGGWELSCFLDEVAKVNKAWVDTKHGEEIQDHMLLEHMRTILTLAKLLRKDKSRGGV